MPTLTTTPATPPPHDTAWRTTHLGHWLRLALQRFDNRTMALVANHPGVPLGLSNLAARGQVGAAHLHLTRHLPLGGARLTELAHAAGMTKQAMGSLVTACESWGMVRRIADPGDARARRIVFTSIGLAWLQAYQDAVRQAEAELRAATSAEVTTVIALGLEAYCA